jgi:hypothetical protein
MHGGYLGASPAGQLWRGEVHIQWPDEGE